MSLTPYCPPPGGSAAEPTFQQESFPESPAIHVVVLPGVDSAAFRWVSVGAEEEGVPCRSVPAEPESVVPGAGDPGAIALAAAQQSRLGVGIVVGRSGVILHEAHMPAECPVWELPLGADLAPTCRLAGGNAGRLVKRMPLRFEQESIPPARERASSGYRKSAAESASPGSMPGSGVAAEYLSGNNTTDLAAVVARIVRSLQERGIV